MKNKLGKQKLWHMYCYFVNCVYFNPTNFKKLYYLPDQGAWFKKYLFSLSNLHTVYDLNITVTGKID